MTAPHANEVAPKRRSVTWRKAPSRLPREQLERLGTITHLAYDRLGGRDGAIAFLNCHHAGLGGKPLDIARDSAAGYAAVRVEVLSLADTLKGERA